MPTDVSSVTKHFPSAENGFTTTLSGTISSGATTVGLNSVAGYSNGEVAVFVVDPSDAAKKQAFTGTVDTSGVQITDVVWTTGTNQTHTAGSTVVDYATATHISMISKGLRVEHDQDGTHGAITAASVTSAGAVSGTALTASANLSMTGGTFSLKGFWDGWAETTDTWVYASATTFTIAGVDRTAMFPVGTKIKLTQTSVKYFYVTASSFSTNTTVTITGGTDYTLADAAITAPFYSYDVTPQGFPREFNYTPTFTNLSGGTLNYARFQFDGKKMKIKFKYTLGGAGVSGAVTVSTPIAISADQSTTDELFLSKMSYLDTGTALHQGNLRWATSNTLGLYADNASTTYLQASALSSTVPHTWANTDVIIGWVILDAA